MRLKISLCRKLCFTLVLALAPLTLSAQSFPVSFDPDFQFSSSRFLNRDWRALKAQGYQESRLNPRAVSPAGAMGVMQFMPATWAECQAALKINASPFNPRASILCGGWYMQRMGRIWNRRGRTDEQVWHLALASYNAGPGSILQAQKRCNDVPLWEHMADCLHYVTGYQNSSETIRYVVLVPQWYYRMQ